jgi:hypothetical protein
VGTRVLVIFDEFDRAASPEFRQNVSEFLKNLSDRSGRVQLAIAAVAENLDELIAPGVMTQRNVVAQEIPPMSGDEVRALVQAGQTASGITFEEDTQELLAQAANGLPYIASLLAQHAGLSALDENRLQVTTQDVHTALTQALSEMKARLPRHSRAVLESMSPEVARTAGPLAARAQLENGRIDLSRSTPPAERTALSSILHELASDRAGLVVSGGADGEYRFSDEDLLPCIWLTYLASGRGSPKEAATMNTARAASTKPRA